MAVAFPIETSLFMQDLSDSKSSVIVKKAGGRLNKKDGLTRYGDSHVKDKTS